MDLENQPLRWGPFWRCVLFKNMVSIYKLYIHIYSYLMDFNGMWAPKASTTWYQWTVIMYLWKLWDASSTWMCILYDRIYILESCMDFLRGTSPNPLILTLHFHPVCHLRNDTGNKWERSPHTHFLFFSTKLNRTRWREMQGVEKASMWTSPCLLRSSERFRASIWACTSQ